MRNVIIIFFLAIGFYSFNAFAGGGHAHDVITSEDAVEKATQKVKQLAKSGKIDASWANATHENVDKKTYAKGPEWVVTFSNNQVADADKQTLYVFFSLDGHYIAANFSGN